MTEVLLDVAGRPPFARDIARVQRGTPSAQHRAELTGRSATVEEIVAGMRAAGEGPHGRRLRGLIVVLWHAQRLRAAWWRTER